MTDKEKLHYYLKAMRTLLSRQDRSRYVLDLLSESIEEEDVNIDIDFFGDGYCLLEEIREELDGEV